MAVSLRAGLPEISTAFVIFVRRACYSIARCIHRSEGGNIFARRGRPTLQIAA
ncbi:hypothetical protein [Geobacillus sp. C56-T2]|uniref:hypothetical protein n=1 Tax=Geobacillus sp. C56-T2 TaxID=600773 RepID=UPI001645B2B5|nr:hypothetical protein [Geobacillus sp. C56-T2]